MTEFEVITKKYVKCAKCKSIIPAIRVKSHVCFVTSKKIEKRSIKTLTAGQINYLGDVGK